MSNTKMTSNKQTSKTFVFSVPTWGAPYIVGEYAPKGDLEMLQKVVMGFIEPIPTSSFVLHPMFCSENKRWDAMRQILTSKSVKVYVNEDGYNRHLQPNMGTILKVRGAGGCPHLLGNLCVVVPEKVLTTLGFQPSWFEVVVPPRELDADEYPVWEPEDDEELAKWKAEWKEKGYEFRESTGYLYKAPFPGDAPDAEESESESESEDEGLGDCVLCDKPITDDKYGHNPAPLAEGKCCSRCNDTKVIPTRMLIVMGRK